MPGGPAGQYTGPLVTSAPKVCIPVCRSHPKASQTATVVGEGRTATVVGGMDVEEHTLKGRNSEQNQGADTFWLYALSSGCFLTGSNKTFKSF